MSNGSQRNEGRNPSTMNLQHEFNLDSIRLTRQKFENIKEEVQKDFARVLKREMEASMKNTDPNRRRFREGYLQRYMDDYKKSLGGDVAAANEKPPPNFAAIKATGRIQYGPERFDMQDKDFYRDSQKSVQNKKFWAPTEEAKELSGFEKFKLARAASGSKPKRIPSKEDSLEVLKERLRNPRSRFAGEEKKKLQLRDVGKIMKRLPGHPTPKTKVTEEADHGVIPFQSSTTTPIAKESEPFDISGNLDESIWVSASGIRDADALKKNVVSKIASKSRLPSILRNPGFIVKPSTPSYPLKSSYNIEEPVLERVNLQSFQKIVSDQQQLPGPETYANPSNQEIDLNGRLFGKAENGKSISRKKSETISSCSLQPVASKTFETEIALVEPSVEPSATPTTTTDSHSTPIVDTAIPAEDPVPVEEVLEEPEPIPVAPRRSEQLLEERRRQVERIREREANERYDLVLQGWRMRLKEFEKMRKIYPDD